MSINKKPIFLKKAIYVFGGYFTGKGAHDSTHLKNVVIKAVEFLRESGASNEAQTLAKVAGMFHDFDRYVPKHHLASAKKVLPFLEKMVKEGVITKRERNTVLKAIVQHYSPVLLRTNNVLEINSLLRQNPYLGLGFVYFAGDIKDAKGDVSLENLNRIITSGIRKGKIRFLKGKPVSSQEEVAKAVYYGDQFDRVGNYGVVRACCGAAEVLENQKVKEIYNSILERAKKEKKSNPEEWAKKEYIKWHQGLNVTSSYNLVFKFVHFPKGKNIEVYVCDGKEYFGEKVFNKLFHEQQIYKNYVDALYKDKKWAWDMTLKIFDMKTNILKVIDSFVPKTKEEKSILDGAKRYLTEMTSKNSQ